MEWMKFRDAEFKLINNWDRKKFGSSFALSTANIQALLSEKE